MMDSHMFFESVRYWTRILIEQLDSNLEYRYYHGRLEGMIIIARDTGLISNSTWRTLYRRLNNLIMSKRNITY